MHALDDLRVLDLTSGPVGGMATTVLADFGADVVKVERPGGDPFRSLAAAPFWLRGKRSLVLDLKQADAQSSLDELAARADVVVVGGRPRGLRALGVDWETLSRDNPSLVHCSIHAWGSRGILADAPGYDALVAAKAGRMLAFRDQVDRDGPVYAALPVASHAAAQGALHGILAALLARRRGGGGQRVETSLLRALMPYDLAELLLVQLRERGIRGIPDPRSIGGGMPTLNYHPVMAADGRWIQLGNLLEHLLYAFLGAIDLLSELLDDPRFVDSPAQWSAEAVEHARDRILLRMRERDTGAWMDIFRADGNVAAEPILTSQEALQHPDVVANGDVVERDDPTLGTLRQLGVVAQLSATPGTVGGPPPAIGADHDAVLRGWTVRPSPERPAANPPPPGRPLAGITVLEVATIIAAPLGTTMLADLGARVIKIEAMGGDPYRHLLPQGVLAVKTNAGKESLCLDLKSDEGRAILRDLIPLADVIVHNFRPGVPERLGLGYEDVRALRADAVWLAATGYGPNCPGAGRPCAHPVAGAAMGGVHFQAGAELPSLACDDLASLREAARRFMRANEANPDPNTSVVIATAALLGLWVRATRGIGQAISVNMLAANAWANADDMIAYAGKPPRPEVDAEGYGLEAGYRLYPAGSGWVFLAALTDSEWGRFAKALARPEWLAARFATRDARRSHDAALAEEVTRAFAQRTADAWESLLLPQGIGCVRADVSLSDVLLRDPHALAEQLTSEVDHARFGKTLRWGALATCGDGNDRLGAGVLGGQHTDALLAEIGRSAEQIARLREAGVVGSEAP